MFVTLKAFKCDNLFTKSYSLIIC